MNPIKQREKDKKLPLILLLGFFVPACNRMRSALFK